MKNVVRSSAVRQEILMLVNSARCGSGLNQAEIARALGISRGRISDWKAGRRVPSTDRVVRLAILAEQDPREWVLRMQRVMLSPELRRRLRVPRVSP